MKLENRYNFYVLIRNFSWKGSMYVPFLFQGKGPKGGSKLMQMLSVKFLEHVIIVS